MPGRIGRYEVLGLLGQGGMGILYLARDPVIDRHVALKQLKVDDEDLRRRFVREARSAGRLQHPNIVTIYEVDEHEGELFIAMEYIDGSTLSALIREAAPLSMLRRLELLDQLADGLGYAHGQGIVHRDIKPANLMVTKGGRLKILDFGIARIIASGAAASVAGGGVLGTPAYMAPEQLLGGEVDHRADIFAVGLVMYELLTGKRAFSGGTAAVVERVLNDAPTPIEELVPSIDTELARCVRRAIAKRADERYQDLLALRIDLARVRRRLELESGAYEATTVVPVPVASGRDGVRPPAMASGDEAPTQPDVAAEASDETIVAPVAGTPPPSPAAPAAATATAQEQSMAGPAGARTGRRSLLPALAVVGVIGLMLAGVALAALWWVRTRLFERPEAAATSVSTSSGALPGADQTESPMPTVSGEPERDVQQDLGGASGPDNPGTPAEPPLRPGEMTARTPDTGRGSTALPQGRITSTAARGAAAAEDSPGGPPTPGSPDHTPDVPPSINPQAPAAADPRDAALAVVRAFVAARNSEHAAGMRRVWPGASDADLRRMTSGSSGPLTLSDCDVAGEGEGRLRADCLFTQPGTTGFSAGTPLTIRRRLEFTMQRQGGEWVITDVSG